MVSSVCMVLDSSVGDASGAGPLNDFLGCAPIKIRLFLLPIGVSLIWVGHGAQQNKFTRAWDKLALVLCQPVQCFAIFVTGLLGNVGGYIRRGWLTIKANFIKPIADVLFVKTFR